MTIIRLAEPKDEDALVDLCYALAEDNNTFGWELDEGAIREGIRVGTERKGGIHPVVDGKNGEIAAASFISWDRQWYSRRYHLTQWIFFVRPEYRASRIAVDLHRWIEDMRRNFERQAGHPVPLLDIVVSEKDLDRKRAWWRRRDGKEVGAIFILR